MRTYRNCPLTREEHQNPPHLVAAMVDIAEGACRVLDHIENTGTEDKFVTGYIRAVRQYALNV